MLENVFPKAGGTVAGIAQFDDYANSSHHGGVVDDSRMSLAG